MGTNLANAAGVGAAGGDRIGKGRIGTAWGLAALLAAGLALSACASGEPAKVADETVPVVLHRVGDSVGVRTGTAAGTVRLRRETPLAFVSDGRVLSVSVREGDVVRAGQQLAQLDRTAIDAAVQSADSRARQSEAEARRQRDLYTKGWVTKARVEAADAAAEAARAEKSSAQFTQRFATIAAPAGGVVLQRLAEPGQTLAAGTPVILLGEFSSGFVLRVRMPAGQAAGLRRGEGATVTFRDGAAPPMAARIIEIAGRADPRTGTFQVEFALPANPALRSGLIADVALPAGGAEGAPVLIPSTALFSARADEGFVWRYADGGVARAQMVKLGAVSGEGVEVVSGLARGDRIVAAGVNRLVEGQKLQVVADPAQTRLAAAR
ncbi:efflux RND transporter periplasmic adaptor subunit [Sandaracinobacteroides hominis]|uniref:efflux RND transporter periplasmic adaptor subunit n=1 Tax=Sandaracinobacteroides hominis TaxID=2780086 RepID=UPI0018F5E741|nr:efflux RND transporter periplasmic adaptor subunit [Sandaracinobacteroides hominis]